MTTHNVNTKTGEILDADDVGREVPVSIGALEQQTRGEIDIQIATAKRFPRSVAVAIKDAMSLACLSEEVAEQCIFAKPQSDGSVIEGPSVRLAEILVSSWGHIRSEARIVEEADKYVTSRGTTWDLEKNVAVAIEVRRSIVKRNGQRFGHEMVTTASNAANAISYRNSVFKIIPRALWEPIYNAAKKVAVGNAETLVAKRKKMVDYFVKMGVTNDRLFARINVKGIEDITLDHLATLRGLANAIKDNEATVDEAFPAVASEPRRASDAPPAADKGKAEDGDGKAAAADDKTDKKKGKTKAAEPPAPAGPFTSAGLKALSVEFDDATKLFQIEMHAGGDAPVGFYMSRDEAHADVARGIVETERTATVTFVMAELSTGEKVKQITAIVVDEAAPASAEKK
jgi:hypothetical protein